MEFLKSLVPASMSGEGAQDHGGGLPWETGPRLLRMKRLGLLAMGHTIEEDQVSNQPGGNRPPHTSRSQLKGHRRLFRKVSFAELPGGKSVPNATERLVQETLGPLSRLQGENPCNICSHRPLLPLFVNGVRWIDRVLAEGREEKRLGIEKMT